MHQLLNFRIIFVNLHNIQDVFFPLCFIFFFFSWRQMFINMHVNNNYMFSVLLNENGQFGFPDVGFR